MLKKMFVLSVFSMFQFGFSQFTILLPYKSVNVVSGNNKAIFEGATLCGEPGQPMLPHYSVPFLLPPDADISTVSFSINQLNESVLESEYTVAPMPPLTCLMDQSYCPINHAIIDGKDIEIYGSDSYYPSSHIGKVTIGKLRQYIIAEVEIIPYRYNPKTKKLIALTGGTLGVSFTKLTNQPTGVERTFSSSSIDSTLKKHVINYEVKSEYNTNSQKSLLTNAVAPSNAERFVIVTTQSIVNSSTQLDNFIASRQQKGFTVQVITESHWGGGTGTVAADRIRAWLRQYYTSLSITHVLLIGDPHPSTGTVPMKISHARFAEGDFPETPTDFYYAELSGNWDADGDGRFGEYADFLISGGPDKYAEVKVGRIPMYGSIQSIDSILAKSISYENETEKLWRRNVLLPMKPTDNVTSGMTLAQKIKNDILIPQSMNFYRLGDNQYWDGSVFPDVTTCNPPVEAIPCTYENVNAVWPTNPFGLIVWSTHGHAEVANDIFRREMISQLTNTRPPFIFMATSNNGQPEYTTNLGYSLLVNGAVATISPTRVSWNLSGETTFGNSATQSGLAYNFTNYFVAQRQSVAEALNNAKAISIVSNSAWWMNLVSYTVYGSPDQSLNAPQPVYLSDLPMVSSTNGLGPVERDMSNGNSGAADGSGIRLGDMAFLKGLGCHANSEVVYNCNGMYKKFSSWMGIDNETSGSGSVVFKVIADGTTIFTSPALTGTTAPRRVTLDINGVNQLKLQIADQDGSTSSDHADWAGAYLGTDYGDESFTLTTAVLNDGVVNISPLKQRYKNNETVTLTAIPFSGNQFTGWSGTVNGTTNPLTITVNQNISLTATFSNNINNGNPVRMELEQFSNISNYSTLTNGDKGLDPASFSGGLGKYSGGTGVRACQSNFTGVNSTYTINFRWHDKSIEVRTGSYRLVIKNGSTEVLNQSWSPSASSTGWYTKTFNSVAVNNGALVQVFAERTSSDEPVIMDYVDFIPVGSTIPLVTYTLTKNVTGAGVILSNPVGNHYENGTQVTLTAIPENETTFIGWSGSLSSSNNPVTLSMNGNKTVTALFQSGNAPITIQAEDGAHCSSISGSLVESEYNGYTGSGFVNFPNAIGVWAQLQINIPVSGVYNLSIRYANGSGSSRPSTISVNGTNITTAQFITTGDWSKWSNEAISGITLKAGTNTILLTATTGGGLSNFDRYELVRTSTPVTYTLSTMVNGSGSISKSPDNTVYQENAEVRLTATPSSGFVFTGWSGDLSGAVNPAVVMMTGNRTITANFAPIQQPLSIQAENTHYCTWSDATVESVHGGFTGSGYVNSINAPATWIQLQTSITVTGLYQLKIRYANASPNRDATLVINGVSITNGSFQNTGAWTTWADQQFVNVTLAAGTNTIRLTAITSGGLPNIDRFDITP